MTDIEALIRRRRRSNSLSLAQQLLGAETDGIAFVFSDQSVVIKDTTTPANAYASRGIIGGGLPTGPGGKLTYTSPSAKWLRQSDGNYRYNAHNLYLNSEAPANQSVTIQSGADYTLILTGSISVTLSGAATGVKTAGTFQFTAASGTLTFGSTSGAGTVHLRRTNSNTDYIKTTSAALYALPYEWDVNGNCLGVLPENAATNLVLNSDAPVTQNVTTSATTYVVSFWGTGTVTLSGTSTAGPLVGTGANDRVSLSFTATAGTLTLTVSGSVSRLQCETGAMTSYIQTFGATATRAVDQIFINKALFPVSATGLMMFAQFSAKAFPAARYVCFGNAAQTAYFDIVHNINNQVRASTDGTNGGSISAFTAYTSGTVKSAISIKLNEFRQAVNGVASTPDLVCTVPNPDNLYISGRIANFGAMNQHIQKVMLLPRSAVDQAEVTALTV